MAQKHVLLIGGTLNQTKSMLAVGTRLTEHRCYYTPFYSDGLLRWASGKGLMNFTAMAGPLRARAMRHLQDAGVEIDDRGEARDYDLIVTCTDLIIQQNITKRPIVLVQEGLTEPEGVLYLGARYLGLPRFLANTAAFGLSHAYHSFCVASMGYRELFARKGVRPDRMFVTGIPNFDHMEALRGNDFPHRDFVLVCTSNARETFKWDNRRRFLKQAFAIADGRPVIVKLHPAERHTRARREIEKLVPGAQVLIDGNTEHMIANASAVVAQYSTVAFTAAALGVELHSYLDPDELRQILPIQNGGQSGGHIAAICRLILEGNTAALSEVRERQEAGPHAVPDLPHVRRLPR